MNTNHKQVIKTLKILDTLDLVDVLEDELSFSRMEICTPQTIPTMYLSKKLIYDATNPLEMITDDIFKIKYSFSKESVMEIMNLILVNPNVQKHQQLMPALTELLLTLRFLLTGSVLMIIDDYPGIRYENILDIVLNTCKLLSKFKDNLIKFPENIKYINISQNVHDKNVFPNILGFLGTMSINLKNHDNKQNYKNELSSLKIQVILLII